MKTVRSTLILTILLALVACNPNRIFESYNNDFHNYRWDKDIPIRFLVNVDDTISEHQVSVALRHVYGYQFQTMKIYVDVKPPSGKAVTKSYDLQVLNSDGYIGDCSGDICDLEVLLEDHVRFVEPGLWRFIIHCDMDLPYVPNVMSFGLLVDKIPSGD